ncbi:vacuolar import and degradation protein-domain-containing protein [Mycena epipterygia]|nr:vacuolar import and degradation protein-domain-containing protein [Mycena epipterygia]
MPSENICTPFKCSTCQFPCQADPDTDCQPDAFVCPGCRAHLLATITVLLPDARLPDPRQDRLCIDSYPHPHRRQRPCDTDQLTPSGPSYRPAYSKLEREPALALAPPPAPTPAPAVFARPPFVSPRQLAKGADPLADITRLRVRAQTHHCLAPRRAGRNSYDVNVTIVDVDFASSFLCGYLRIRGLTDDWPELTTYFDAEIIGSRYGFLTQNWGATEQADTVHWSRFPAYRHVKAELKKPHNTIPDRDRGAVFMRWKERFLVPDHRVQDINGASFAGFYYVCVDFNPAPAHDEGADPQPDEAPMSPAKPRRDSSVRRALSTGPRPALMSGFYFHQNSEPYQQLTLSHLPERTSSSFEFR